MREIPGPLAVEPGQEERQQSEAQTQRADEADAIISALHGLAQAVPLVAVARRALQTPLPSTNFPGSPAAAGVDACITHHLCSSAGSNGRGAKQTGCCDRCDVRSPNQAFLAVAHWCCDPRTAANAARVLGSRTWYGPHRAQHVKLFMLLSNKSCFSNSFVIITASNVE